MQSLDNIVRFSGNNLFSVNLFYSLKISLTCSLNLYPPLFAASEEQQFLECTSLLSALQSWFLPMSSVCCNSPSLPFCQGARALWRFLNPPNINGLSNRFFSFLSKPSCSTKNIKLSISWLRTGQMSSASFQRVCTILRKTKNL